MIQKSLSITNENIMLRIEILAPEDGLSECGNLAAFSCLRGWKDFQSLLDFGSLTSDADTPFHIYSEATVSSARYSLRKAAGSSVKSEKPRTVFDNSASNRSGPSRFRAHISNA